MENEDKIKIADNTNLKINRVEVVGDLYDDAGNKLGSGNYTVSLNADEVALLGITNIQEIANKFYSGEKQG